MRAASIDAHHLPLLVSHCGGTSICFFVSGTNTSTGGGGDKIIIRRREIRKQKHG
eukprot:SAG11_NODE_3170_length_2637_cov_4.585500_4_plen_55_part_00